MSVKNSCKQAYENMDRSLAVSVCFITKMSRIKKQTNVLFCQIFRFLHPMFFFYNYKHISFKLINNNVMSLISKDILDKFVIGPHYLVQASGIQYFG